MKGERPGLVVIDSCESAGCPSDGGAVKPWFDKFCKPWESIGATLLLLDHVPKRKEERPLGAIGSTHKRSKMTGAAIFVTGTPWNQLEGGKLLLVNHKDRAGQLMVSPNKPICNIIATYVDGVLAYTITPPEREDIDAAQVADSLLFEIAKMGSDGVTGSRAVRSLVKHKGKTADIALEDLMKAGLVDRYKTGKAWLYFATPEGNRHSRRWRLKCQRVSVSHRVSACPDTQRYNVFRVPPLIRGHRHNDVSDTNIISTMGR